MVELKEVVPVHVLKNLDDLIACLSSSTDIRTCLSLLVPIAFAFRGLVEITDDAEIRFFSYLVVDQFGNVQNAYDGRTSNWYELNAANVSQMRKLLLEYCRIIKDAILSNDCKKLVEGTITFFNNFHPLARATTRDIRET
ncbi:MAG: hypothetical protein QXZ02_06025 [Candidatus Bathyarchaeia archaeon]